MSANPNEGNPQGAGEANANSQSSTTGSQPLEGDFAVLIANLQKKIDAQDGEIRALKSGKDKAVDRVVKSQEETLAKLAKYLNVDEQKVQEAQRQSVLDDLVAERLGNRSIDPPASGKAEGSSKAVELQAVDTALELPANDSRVTDLKLQHGNDLAVYLREALKLKSQLSQTSEPSPAEMPLPLGSAPTRGEENPIKNITDSRTLYRMAAQQFKKK